MKKLKNKFMEILKNHNSYEALPIGFCGIETEIGMGGAFKNKFGVLKISFIILSTITFYTYAQVPNWSVNPNNYQYNMNYTLVLNMNFVESRDIADKIGAFVGSTCVGVSSPVFVPGVNRYIAYLTVYSNRTTGDNISFRLYDNSIDQSFTFSGSYGFLLNGSVGITTKPVIISVPKLSNEANLLDIQISNQESPTIFNGSVTSALLTAFVDRSTQTTTLTTSTMARVFFANSINGNYLNYSSSGINLTNKVFFKLISSDESTEKFYELSVGYQNAPPTNISLTGTNTAIPIKKEAFFGKLFTQDLNTTDLHTYSFASGSGDDDNAAFRISRDTVYTTNFNYKSKQTYSLRIKTDDGKFKGTFEKIFSFNFPNQTPTDISIVGVDFLTGNYPTTLLSTIKAIDADVQDTFVYSIVSGVGGEDNARFTLINDNLVARNLPFATQLIYNVRILADDNKYLGQFSKSLVYTIPNAVPTDISLSGIDFNNPIPKNKFFAKIQTNDADNGDKHSYTLKSGVGDADNGKFLIKNDSIFTTNFAYKSQGTYNIRLETWDGKFGGRLEKTFSLVFPNQTPTDISIVGVDFLTGNYPTTILSTIKALDADVQDTFVYSIVSGVGGDDNARFTLRNDTLRARNLPFATQLIYNVRILADDNKYLGQFSKSLVYTIPNAVPTDISLSGIDFNNPIPKNKFFAKIQTNDADNGDKHSYTLKSGVGDADNGKFLIKNDSIFTTNFAYKSQGTYNIRLETWDGKFGGRLEKTFSLVFPNQTPTDISIVGVDFLTGNYPTTILSTIKALDADVQDTFVYSIVSGVGGEDNARFTLRNDTLRARNLPFATQLIYNVRILADDNKYLGQFSKSLVYTIPNTVPTDISLSGIDFNNPIPKNKFFAKIQTNDADNGDIHTYTLKSGVGDTDNGKFLIKNDSIFTTNFAYKTQETYNIRLETWDGKFGGRLEKTFSLVFPNQTPTDISIVGLNFLKGNYPNGLLAFLKGIDADVQDKHTFEFVTTTGIESQDNFKFSIRGDSLFTNRLTVETQGTYLIKIRADDQKFNGIYDKNITFVIPNNIPSDISVLGTNYTKGKFPNKILIKLETIDSDVDDIHKYNFVSGLGDADNAKFKIKNDTLYSDSLDFKTQKKYTIRIRTFDGKFAGFFSKTFEIDVPNNVPSDIVFSESTFIEGNKPASVIAKIKAIDADKADKHTYTFVAGQGSDDNASFELKGDSLIVPFSFDYETKKSYTIRIKADDGIQFGSIEKVLVIDIIDKKVEKVDADNIITPTPKDGINDYWVIRNIEDFQNSKLSIFNEAGVLIYSTTKYENDWDGISNGSELPSATYYYVISSVEGDFTGFISIIRRQ